MIRPAESPSLQNHSGRHLLWQLQTCTVWVLSYTNTPSWSLHTQCTHSTHNTHNKHTQYTTRARAHTPQQGKTAQHVSAQHPKTPLCGALTRNHPTYLPLQLIYLIGKFIVNCKILSHVHISIFLSLSLAGVLGVKFLTELVTAESGSDIHSPASQPAVPWSTAVRNYLDTPFTELGLGQNWQTLWWKKIKRRKRREL